MTDHALITSPSEAAALCDRLDIALGYPKQATGTDRYTDFTVNGDLALIVLGYDVLNYLLPAEKAALVPVDHPDVTAFWEALL